MDQQQQGKKRQRRRSNTFTNVVGVEPHGYTPSSDTIDERRWQNTSSKNNNDKESNNNNNNNNSNNNSNNGNNSGYYQIAGEEVSLIDEERRNSFSSVDTNTDLLDHRDSSFATPGDESRRVFASGTPINSPNHYNHNSDRNHQHVASSSHQPKMSSSLRKSSTSYNSPSMVERWAKRNSVSQVPLIDRQNPSSTDYNAITDGLNGSDSFAITMDDPQTQTTGIQSSQAPDGIQRFIDINSDMENELDSNPSSRRSSNASSLHDVCFPMEMQQETDSIQGETKQWPDLQVLIEFAEQECQEIEATEQAIVDDVTGERTYSLTSERNGGGSASGYNGTGGILYNNSNLGTNLKDRLRPHRIVPWAQRTKGKKDRKQKHFKTFDEKSPQYRFTYFREDLDATIHSPNISGLLQPGQEFDELFPPRYPNLPSDENNNGSSNSSTTNKQPATLQPSTNASATAGTTTASSRVQTPEPSAPPSPLTKHASLAGRRATQSQSQSSRKSEPGTDFAPFWLDVMNPTEEEMKVISKTFGIHPLTTEDIFHGETREKVELFRNYYLVCFRSIDTNWGKSEKRGHRHHYSNYHQGRSGSFNKNNNSNGSGSGNANATGYSELAQEPRNRKQRSESSTKRTRSKGRRRKNELKALNMYMVVFHEGVLTFHFAPTTHPINVRRRARLLQDYITVSSDWISYALIDDVTDGFAPLIEAIEDDVNGIEEEILKMHSGESSDSDSDDSDSDNDDDGYDYYNKKHRDSNGQNGAASTTSTSSSSSASGTTRVWKEKGDMLRRIGECRKRVMSLLRLLGNKADVIKGFSKRCNEQWDVAPRSEIALFLGDIQDHIVTMVQSLNHYEKLLARSHSNYLAQINIDMTRVNNDMNDVLGRITVLGTIVLPMNIVTGLWGMNVLVPGQDRPDLIWFYCITAGLLIFAAIFFVIARKVYKI